MKKFKIELLITAAGLIIALCIYLVSDYVDSQWQKEREAECETLKKIGAHRGESIMVFGDVPTWKLECLFDNGGL